MANAKHWTGESDAAFVHKLGFDFITQIEKKMAESDLSQSDLAKILGISEGAISKTLNNPQNLTLKTIAKYSKALGIKTSIVAYDDGDSQNEHGLVPSEIFTACWQNAGKPRDFWSLQEISQNRAGTTSVLLIDIKVFISVAQPDVYFFPYHVHDLASSSTGVPFLQNVLSAPAAVGTGIEAHG